MAHSSRHKPRHYGHHRPLRPSGPWANGPIPVVGLVGPIGAGKSVAAAALGGLGLAVLDADAVGHALLNQRPCRDLVVDRFGSGILAAPAAVAPEGDDEADGPAIDRAVLGRIVFNDPAARRDLEAILHPSMRKTFERAIDRAGRREAPGVVLDAAILFEAGWNDLCDAVVYVDAPREARAGRVAASRGWSADDLDSRERAQSPASEKRGRADVVLTNDGDPETFRAAILAWWASFRPARATGPGKGRGAPRGPQGRPRR